MTLDRSNNELPPAWSYSPEHRTVDKWSGSVRAEQRSQTSFSGELESDSEIEQNEPCLSRRANLFVL